MTSSRSDLPEDFSDAPQAESKARWATFGALVAPLSGHEKPQLVSEPRGAFCSRCQSQNGYPGGTLADGERTTPCDGSGIITGSMGHVFGCPFLVDYSREVRAKDEKQALSEEWPVPPRYAEASSASPPPGRTRVAELYTRATQWLRGGQDGSLLLVGPPGCGKTHLASALLNECRGKGWRTAFAQAQQVVSRITRTYGKDSEESAEDIIDGLARSEMMVLDDWGKHRITAHSDGLVSDLVNRRYEEKRRTVVTLNESARDGAVAGDLLDMMTSRMTHNAVILHFPAESLRGHHTIHKAPTKEELS
jgi:hypothetical protein